MGIIALVVWAIIIGAIVGALGRLVVPGRNPIGVGLTVLLGIVGAVVGGFIGHALLGRHHAILTFIIEVAVAAVLVALVSGGSRRSHRVM